MTTIRRFVLRLLTFFRSGSAESELSREIHSHLQLIEDEFVAKGMPRDEARLAARRAFGGVEQAKVQHRDTRGFRWLEDSRIDFKLGARMLVKYPGLSLIGGAGLAVGIAIGAAFFAMTYAFFNATIPGDGGDRIVALENWDIDANNEMLRSMHDLLVWQREMKTVEQIGAFRTVGRTLTIPGGSVEGVQVAQITATGFDITRVAPVIGRPLLPADESADATPVVVIGHDVWQSKFGGETSVLGRELRLGDAVHTVVGVMPEGYGFPINHSYWVPFRIDASGFGRREGPEIYIFGRVRDGVSMAQAQAELSAIGTQAASAYPQTHARLQPRVFPYAHSILDIQDVSAAEFAGMQSLMSLLAVIIAINVGVLVYARTATRQQEIAVRTAIGASRARIVGQLFIEALVLTGTASIAGIALARFGLTQGYAIAAAEGSGGLPYFLNVGMPLAAYVYVSVLTVFAALIAGVLPALRATGQRVQDTLKKASGTHGLQLGRVWTLLIVAQVAIAVAGLPATIAISSTGIQRGLTKANYREESFLAAILDTDADAPGGVPVSNYAHDLLRRFEKSTTDLVSNLEAEPAVDDVTVALAIPGNEPRARIAIDGTIRVQSGALDVGFNRVATDFFDVFGARIITGRTLRASDSAGDTQAIVVNRAFVTQILGGDNAIGRRLHYASAGSTKTHYEIVGVATDLGTNPVQPDLIDPVIYHALRTSTRATALIRLRGSDPLQFSSRLREMTSTLDPSMRLRIVSFSEVKAQH